MRSSLLALLLCAYGVLCWNTYAVPPTNKNSSVEHSLTSPNPEGEIEDVWFFTRRGGVRLREGKFAEAIADYTRVIALSPTNAYAYCNRGACLSEMGDFDRAVSDLNVAIALDPNLTASYFNRATVRRRQGDLDAALADFTKVIELDPKKLKGYESRWFVFYKLGRPDEAIQDINKVIELDPRRSSAFTKRGIAKILKGDTKGALSDCKTGVRLARIPVDASFANGFLHYLERKYAQAIADWKRVIVSDPNAREEMDVWIKKAQDENRK